jgi:structural maintenance of chromosome 4
MRSSTACGPLDNIVVDTVDTAQKCIPYLKNGNLGRASFIALEKMVGTNFYLAGNRRQFNFAVHYSCSIT